MSTSRRRARRAAPLALWGLVLGACAVPRDHFYALTVLPEAPRAPAAGFATHVILKVSIPVGVDRRQMVLAEANDQLLILEHERWPAPLSDLVSQTLARDLERRRADVLVAGRGFDQPDAKPVRIQIDVVRLSVRRGGNATLEAHWRIADPAMQTDQVGGETFSATVSGPVAGDDYAPAARALSTCLAMLADRLAEKLPVRSTPNS
jgi:uncharacterized lipoprotein YmbA